MKVRYSIDSHSSHLLLLPIFVIIESVLGDSCVEGVSYFCRNGYSPPRSGYFIIIWLAIIVIALKDNAIDLLQGCCAT